MLHFEGDKDFSNHPQAELWPKLTDCRFLVRGLPADATVSVVEPGRAVWKLRPGVSFVRGTLETTLTIVEATPETSVRYRVQSKGIGSSNEVNVSLALTPQGVGTRVHWVADVTELSGLLKAMPKGLIQAAAQKVIEDLWVSVESKLSAER